MMRQAFKVMNRTAFKFLGVQFKKFRAGTKKPVYAAMTKKKKKALFVLMHYCTHTVERACFTRFAINTKQFHKLSHPKTKFIGSVNCLFRNFRIVRQRLAFLKMKKNLNMFLRQAMKSYQENDKDLFIQLN